MISRLFQTCGKRGWGLFFAAFSVLLMIGCGTMTKPGGLRLITLPALDGPPTRVFKAGTNLTVVLFVAVDCPVSNRLAPEYSRLAADYSAKGVEFRLVYSGDDAAPELVRKHREEYGLKLPALLDKNVTLARWLGARWTPEAFLCVGGGDVIYHGRVNNLFEDYGRMRPEPTIHDLRRALDEALAGGPVSESFVRPIGCHLPAPPAGGR